MKIKGTDTIRTLSPLGAAVPVMCRACSSAFAEGSHIPLKAATAQLLILNTSLTTGSVNSNWGWINKVGGGF